MTQPTPPPPDTVGTQPKNAAEVNGLVGLHLKAAPYYFTAAQETDLKTAVSQLDAALDAVDMTFINRIVGMF